MIRYKAKEEKPYPDVSVVIAHYNSGGDIVQAVRSALDQTGITVEVIVVDDCSTDGSDALVLAIAGEDSRVRLLRMDHNGGPSAARNRAIRDSRATWISVLDADDRFLPGRLRRLVSKAEYGGAHAVADNIVVSERKNSFLAFSKGWMNQDEPMSIATLLRRGTPWEIDGLPIGYIKPLVSREFLLENGIVYDERLRISEDFMLYFDIIRAGGRFILDDFAGYVAVVKERSLSHGDDTVHRRVLQVHDLMAKKLNKGSKDEMEALGHRRDALALELAISEFKHGRIGACALVISGIHISYILMKIVRACVKRVKLRAVFTR